MIDEATGWFFVPASIKGVVVADRKVVLCRNHREEWELPGGWPDRADRRLQDTVEREVMEECGLKVSAGEVVHAGLLAIGENLVTIVALQAAPIGDVNSMTASFEHTSVSLFDVDALPDALPDVYREAIVRGVGR